MNTNLVNELTAAKQRLERHATDAVPLAAAIAAWMEYGGMLLAALGEWQVSAKEVQGQTAEVIEEITRIAECN